MGLLNKLFGGSSATAEAKVLPWIPLHSTTQLHTILKQSKNKPQIIFKHSNRCGISSMVIRQFTNAYNFTESDFDLYYLDILSYRNVSDEVSYELQVMHESPQLLIIKNGQVVMHASHGSINAINLKDYL